MDDVVDDGDEADGDIRVIRINCNSSNSFINTSITISINITIRMIVNRWQNVSGKAEKQRKALARYTPKESKHSQKVPLHI